MKYSILLVEDDEDLATHLAQYLQMRAFKVQCARDGVIARQLLSEKSYDLLLVDVMMPREDGFTLAKYLTGSHPQVPFLFLTARDQKQDVLKGFGLGAEDYIRKPFDVEELVLRLHNILKRSKPGKHDPEVYQFGAFRFAFNNLLLAGPLGERALTEKEALLLKMLSSNKNNLVNRDDVLRELWGEPDFFNGRSLDVFISRLRKYLSADSRVQLESIRGVGFRLNEDC
ncbi:response regulator transcription factor [Mucilaginibacter koreensis]